MPVNLNANLTSQTDFSTNPENSISSVKQANNINNSSGITGISELSNTKSNISTGNAPILETPKLPLEEIINSVVKLDTSTAQKLGVAAGTLMNIIEFNKAVLEKIDSKTTNNSTSTTNMDAETLELYCMLLCQSSKEKMIKSFKSLLDTKIKERNEKQEAYAKEVAEITNKNVDAAVKAKQAEQKAKTKGLFKAIFSVIASIVAVAVSVVVTVGTAGTGGAAFGFAIAGCVAAVASCAATSVSSGLTIGALYTNNPDTKAALNNWAMGFGIGAAVIGIAGAILSGGAGIFSTVDTIQKVFNGIGSIVSGLSQIFSGSLDIITGTDNIKLAKLQKELANMKIDLAKLDETIALLNKLIENLSEDTEAFIKNFLEGEQQVAKEIINISEAQSNLENEMPC